MAALNNPPAATTTTAPIATKGVDGTVTNTTDPGEYDGTAGDGRTQTVKATAKDGNVTVAQTRSETQHRRVEECPSSAGTVAASVEQTFTETERYSDGAGNSLSTQASISFTAQLQAHVDDDANLTTFDVAGAVVLKGGGFVITRGTKHSTTVGPVTSTLTYTGLDGHHPDSGSALDQPGALSIVAPAGTKTQSLSDYYKAVGTFAHTVTSDGAQLFGAAENIWRSGKCATLTATGIPSSISATQTSFAASAHFAATRGGAPPVVKFSNGPGGGTTYAPPNLNGAEDSFTATETNGAWHQQRSMRVTVSASSRMGLASFSQTVPVTAAYLVTYKGTGAYFLSRTNTFMNATFSEDYTTHYGWTTSFTVLLDPANPDAVTADGKDTLGGGSAESHRVDTGTVNADSDVTCTSLGDLQEVGTNPPQITVAPGTSPSFAAPSGGPPGSLLLTMDPFNVAQWESECSDGPGELLYPIDTDNDHFGDPYYPLTGAVIATSAGIAGATKDQPYVISVPENQHDEMRNCADPSDGLISCDSNLEWSATVTIQPAG